MRVGKPGPKSVPWFMWFTAGAVLALATPAAILGVRHLGASPTRDWEAIERAIARKNLDDAEVRLTRWLVRTPGEGKALLRLGVVYAVKGQDDRARDQFLRVAAGDPAWPVAQGRLGEYWLQRGNLVEAERALRNAAGSRPRAVEARRRLIRIFTLEQRNDEARYVLWELYRLTGDPRHLVTMAGLSTTEPDARDPNPELDKFLRLTPDDPLLRRAQGLRLLRLGRPADARRFLESVVAVFAHDPSVRLALAECQILLGDTAGVAGVLGPVPTRPEQAARWWQLTGQTAEINGREREALACWRKAVEADPTSRVASYRLGQALSRKGEETEAKAQFGRAEEIRLREVNLILAMDRFLRGGRDADLMERLAACCRDAGLLPEARAWYEEVIRIDPARASAQTELPKLDGVGAPPSPPTLRHKPPAAVLEARPPYAAAPADTAHPVTRFEDMAPRCGIDFRYDSGATGDLFIGDTMGGGVALFDADNDGRLDVYLINGCALPFDPNHPPAPNKLYRNKANWEFEDMTDRAGVGGRGYGMGCAVGDYDNDGDDDLFLTGLGATVLYRNRGDGTFEDVTGPAGVRSDRWTTAAAFADLDGDGDLDLVAAGYVKADPRHRIPCKDPLGNPIHCPPGHYPPEPDHLFRNNGDGTFTDVGREAGLNAGAGPGLGLALADLDGDGRLDVFVANDATPNFLYRNLGGLKFEEVGVASGVAYDGTGRATASMGVVADDLDDDGLIDLLHTNFVNESSTLLKNLGGGRFLDVTGPSGLTAPSREMTGFGAVGFDADNDGRVDLFIANGHVDDRPWEGRSMGQRPQLFANRGGGRFAPVADAAPYFASKVVGRGAAAGDLDGDGRVDLVVVHRGARAAVLRNRTDAGHWLGLRLRGAKSSRTPVGARVTCRAGGRTLTRWLTTGTSYLAAGDNRVWLGLGSALYAEHLEVCWPSGQVQTWSDLPADRLLDLKENFDPTPAAGGADGDKAQGPRPSRGGRAKESS